MAFLLLFSPGLCKISYCKMQHLLSVTSLSSLPFTWALNMPYLLPLFLSALYAPLEVCPVCTLSGWGGG